MNYVSFVRRARYDIVDAWLYPADVMAALARPLTQTPVVMAGRRNVDLRNQFGIAERLIGAATNRLTDVVVANSAAAAAVAVETQGVDPAKIRMIRNGVIVGQPSSSEERAFRRQELGATDNDIVVGCVANYREVKGLDRLIEVAAARPRWSADPAGVNRRRGPGAPNATADQRHRTGPPDMPARIRA